MAGRTLALVLLVFALRVPAAAQEQVDTEEKRLVIALFDGATRPLRFDFEDPVHQVYEMPLNYLGLVVRRHDVREGPPPAAWLERARAVLTCFANVGGSPDWLWPWLEREVPARGLRVVHLGDFGPLARPDDARYDPRRLRTWLRRFGLEYDDFYFPGPLGVRVAFANAAACRVEADPSGRAVHRGPHNVSARNRTWIETTCEMRKDDVRTPVVTGPWGGIALDPWTVGMGGDDEDRRWFLDLFAFFREAMGLDRVPAPQPYVLNGRRVFLLHVDGDGFESLSSLQRNAYSAKVMLDEVFRRYPLPYTVSIIVRSLTDDYEVAEPTPAMKLAREILNLPNVEPASHGVLHPLRWDLPLLATRGEHKAAWYPSLRNYEYGPVAEVRESVRFINERLMDEGRRCRVMLWTGSTNAPVEAIRECARVGCWNLNGGVFRWDKWYDSISFVSPWARLLEDQVQVYAGAANENDFEGFFDNLPTAFGHIDQTIERTGRDRILKPANLYVHFYSAEQPGRLATLHKLIRRWAFEEETAPVFASDYARGVVSAIQGCRVFRRPDGWALREFGDCRTVRIDGETRDVDFERSRGVLGARRLHGSLHVHLSAPDADVVLADAPAPRPHVEQANHILRDVRLDANGVALGSAAYSRREIGFAGFPPGADLSLEVDGVESTRLADETGRAVVTLDPGSGSIRIRTRPSDR